LPRHVFNDYIQQGIGGNTPLSSSVQKHQTGQKRHKSKQAFTSLRWRRGVTADLFHGLKVWAESEQSDESTGTNGERVGDNRGGVEPKLRCKRTWRGPPNRQAFAPFPKDLSAQGNGDIVVRTSKTSRKCFVRKR